MRAGDGDPLALSAREAEGMKSTRSAPDLPSPTVQLPADERPVVSSRPTEPVARHLGRREFVHEVESLEDEPYRASPHPSQGTLTHGVEYLPSKRHLSPRRPV